MPVAQAIVIAAAAYAAAGIIFAIAFVLRGASAIDPAARASTLGFRVMIFPGAAALWPILAPKWLRSRRSPTPGETT